MINTGNISIEALRQGDRQEMARLVNAYSNALYRAAYKILGNQQDAEDVLQNTFLRAFQSMKEFEGRSSVSTWLYRIVVNEALMILRKQRPQVSIEEPSEDTQRGMEHEPLELTDWCCLPEEELLSSESRQALDSAIQQLPNTLRIIFVLRDIEQLSIQETAQITGLSQTAVKTRLLRARLRLREHLSTFFRERMPERRK